MTALRQPGLVTRLYRSFWQGALDAVQAVGWPRLLASAALVLLPGAEGRLTGHLPSLFTSDVAVLGPTLVLGLASPSGASLPDRADRSRAAWCGGLLRALLAGALVAGLLRADGLVMGRHWLLEWQKDGAATIPGCMALVAEGLWLWWGNWILAATLAFPIFVVLEFPFLLFEMHTTLLANPWGVVPCLLVHFTACQLYPPRPSASGARP